ncbi:HEAT repeat domain-containing protein [Fusobacterium sp.]|uniref:HEAT repeat domain-containing protein n=1 Tax=Fusobacterium sp. TaxID=68766 RepID=UPI002A80636E|nr:HEAT repeat domain-containing protein [Fusobacterium sp.]
MTTEEREMILNLSYEELIEKFKNELQKVIKFLQDEQKKDIDNDTEYIIEKLITLIIIIIEDYYLEDDSFNELLIELAYDKNHYEHENIALIFENLHSPKLINCVYNLAVMELDYKKEDEFFNIARKCTYALGYTNTPKAKEKLELLAKNENELIREYAIKQLNRHDFTDKDVEEQD